MKCVFRDEKRHELLDEVEDKNEKWIEGVKKSHKTIILHVAYDKLISHVKITFQRAQYFLSMLTICMHNALFWFGGRKRIRNLRFSNNF